MACYSLVNYGGKTSLVVCSDECLEDLIDGGAAKIAAEKLASEVRRQDH